MPPVVHASSVELPKDLAVKFELLKLLDTLLVVSLLSQVLFQPRLLDFLHRGADLFNPVGIRHDLALLRSAFGCRLKLLLRFGDFIFGLDVAADFEEDGTSCGSDVHGAAVWRSLVWGEDVDAGNVATRKRPDTGMFRA